MKSCIFPFSAIVGQDEMKTALLLNAVDPSIGGVLIRGQKGTAKSTAARALASLLPELEVIEGCPYHCAPYQRQRICSRCLEQVEQNKSVATALKSMPMVELPLSATEDRVVGTIHLEETLKSGQRIYEPGLLASANRGILYVDEVNLLEDHLIDLLLDAAASGVNRVEREGLCITHPAWFMLIGTMNPEEGELRPQFLDRFGLTVIVEGIQDSATRRELIRRRLDFESDPQVFCERWEDHDAFLSKQVVNAREHLGQVKIPEAMVSLVADLVIELDIHGHRADIALLKGARALAALLEKTEVGLAEIGEVAQFVLPHRLPGVLPGQSATRQMMMEALAKVSGQGYSVAVADEEAGDFALEEDYGDFEYPGAAAAGSMLFETFKKKLQSA